MKTSLDHTNDGNNKISQYIKKSRGGLRRPSANAGVKNFRKSKIIIKAGCKYMSRKGGRRLINIGNSVNASIGGCEDYIKKSQEELVTATRNSNDNIKINITSITRKYWMQFSIITRISLFSLGREVLPLSRWCIWCILTLTDMIKSFCDRVYSFPALSANL